MDKTRFDETQALIKQNSNLKGFELYYLGFFSHFFPKLSISDVFTHISNVISLHASGLMSDQEKIEFMIRMLAKQVTIATLKSLAPSPEISDKEAMNILQKYFE